ncbi:16S rRNA (adenine(1408)-N(1))-methyltransferase KamB [Actinokineospora inagensis]|uniref:16S rRNA (adenine(1408)-N(1))-methyltransferase KamB n=1 Tax=Actinokineospora inagensis TaxID=103730 RepID=UPI000412B74B|nr:16S rRNA (adenine(1408)-N(1))-methyltransferase KamB [Actinokineospora inagensis]
MRRVTGKQVVQVDRAEFAALRGRYTAALLDVGTGDGKHALHLARAHPDLLVIGLDAATDNMRRAATKAAASPKKGGLPNLLYLWAAAEQPPAELSDITEVHVLMPWGSLLRGVLGSDPAMLTALAALCAPDTPFLITLNLHAWRPPVPEVGTHPEPTPDSAAEDLGPALKAAHWHLHAAEYLDDAGIAALATSWTRRLNSSRDRLDVLALRGLINPT